MLNPEPRKHNAVEWLPAERLGQAKVDAAVRPWLIGKGLLTLRLKDVGGAEFSLRLVSQYTSLLDAAQRAALCVDDSAALFREVKMCCGAKTWVYAQTIIPDSTLSIHPWLGELGDAALGETLNDLTGVARSSYEYAWFAASEGLTQRALGEVDLKPAGLWSRRSRFVLHGAALLVQELFFPQIGQR